MAEGVASDSTPAIRPLRWDESPRSSALRNSSRSPGSALPSRPRQANTRLRFSIGITPSIRGRLAAYPLAIPQTEREASSPVPRLGLVPLRQVRTNHQSSLAPSAEYQAARADCQSGLIWYAFGSNDRICGEP